MKLFTVAVFLCLKADGLLGEVTFCPESHPFAFFGIAAPGDSCCNVSPQNYPENNHNKEKSACWDEMIKCPDESGCIENPVNLCGYMNCKSAIAFEYEIEPCDTTWEYNCGPYPVPPEGFTRQSTLYELCPVECPEAQAPAIEEPVACVWAEWTPSSCSATCGDGEQIFTRNLTSGDEASCNGCKLKVEKCTIDKECPVDCQWSEWEDSKCTASCGGGTKTRTRKSQLPEETLKNTPSCMHELVLVETCNLHECPVNCEWARWQDQECDCKSGLMTRTRQKKKLRAHGGKDCEGSASTTWSCNYLQCKIPYVIGKEGEVCDEDKKIMDSSDCEIASKSTYLDLEWTTKDPSNEVQKGCLVDNEKTAWFNSHDTGSEKGAKTRPICKQDPNLCPDECKTMCVSPPRGTPGRRNKHHNGYCYKWCANVDNPNANTNDGTRDYCGVSMAIKENAIDCRGCYKAFH